MKYLITGGAGFIGSNAADYFLSKGSEVIIFDSFSRSGARANVDWLKSHYPGEAPSVVTGDVSTEAGFKALRELMNEVDGVLHLAGQVAVTTSVTNPRQDFLANLLGTFNVLEAIRLAAHPPALIYASTNKVYGSLDELAVVEETKRYRFRDVAGVSEKQNLDFHSPYGCSKGAGDQYVRDYARIYGLRTVVCRQSCIYGPRQFGIEDQGWLAWFMIAFSLGKPITIYGTGKQVRDVLHVSDLVKLYDLLFANIDKAAGQIFNIGGGPANTLSLLEFMDILEKKSGQSLHYQKGETRPGDQPIYISDISKIKNALNWQPEVDVDKGIDLLWNWIQENKQLFA